MKYKGLIINIAVLIIGVVLGLVITMAFGYAYAAKAGLIWKVKLKVGDVAPDFTLPSAKGPTYTLSDYRGLKNVVLAFYPLAFTPV